MVGWGEWAAGWKRWLWGTRDEADAEHEHSGESWSPTAVLSSYGRRKYHQLVDSQLDSFMPFMKNYLLSYIVETEANEKSTEVVAGEWQETWPDIELDLRWKLRRKLGVPDTEEQKLLYHLRLDHWAKYPPLRGSSGWPQPFTALRARILHMMHPADEHQDRRVYYVLLILNLSAMFQLCNWTMFVHFLLIDKSDEHQLVLYILANKGYHFIVYGAIQFVQNAAAYFNCVLEDIDMNHPCSDGAPGRNLDGNFEYYIEFMFEQIRIASVWYAFYLLRRSKGGPAHMARLERARLGEASSSISSETLAEEFGLAERHERGGVLRFMFAYDLACFIFCYAFGALNLIWKMQTFDCTTHNCTVFVNPVRGHIPFLIEHFKLLRDWRFTMTLDFSETTYSLLTFPFFLLCMRPLRKYMIGSRPTGYDRAGNLQAELNFAQKEERARLEAMKMNAERAATLIQARMRGKQARV